MTCCIQTGMMKDNVSGPIKCYEAIATNICLQTRAKELVYSEHFHLVEFTKTTRGREDKLGGKFPDRVHGSPCIHTPLTLFCEMLRLIIDEIADTHEEAWQHDGLQHEDLAIREYTSANVGASTHLTIDLISSNRTTFDYYMYWSYAKLKVGLVQIEMPIKSSMKELQSMDKPPLYYIHAIQH